MMEKIKNSGDVGEDKMMGEGEGIMVKIKDRLFREEMESKGIEMKKKGKYGVGYILMKREKDMRENEEEIVREVIEEEGKKLIGLREVKVDNYQI